jgi:hypothetical protein
MAQYLGIRAQNLTISYQTGNTEVLTTDYVINIATLRATNNQGNQFLTEHTPVTT